MVPHTVCEAMSNRVIDGPRQYVLCDSGTQCKEVDKRVRTAVCLRPNVAGGSPTDASGSWRCYFFRLGMLVTSPTAGNSGNGNPVGVFDKS